MAEGSGDAETAGDPKATASLKDLSAQRESKATVWSAIFAGVSLIALIASIFISFNATKLTEQQNNDARQQELVTLVTDIEQGQQGSSSINGQSISVELAQLGEAEEANSVINSLPSSEVSSVERYIVGIGLEDGYDYQSALALFTAAAREASDQRTSADAWRAAATINYKLGFRPQAESDINQAKSSFGGPDTRSFNEESNRAFTDLFDVPYRAPFDCSVAVSEWSEAAGLYSKNNNILSGPNAIANEKNAAKSLAGTCHVPSSVLKEIPLANNLPQPGSSS